MTNINNIKNRGKILGTMYFLKLDRTLINLYYTLWIS